jgi:hypothetical protein
LAANMACDYIDGFIKELAEHADWTAMIEEGKWSEIVKEARVAHRKKKESAGEWGTEVHTQAEEYINYCIEKEGGMAGTPFPKDYPKINHFIKWAADNKVKFLASEKHVYSKEMWVGGICDIICEIDGKRYVGDIKTSSGIYPEAFIQCSAYAEMLKEMGEYEKFDGVVILNLKKDGTFDYKYNYDMEGNFKCFQAALTIYRQLNAIDTRPAYQKPTKKVITI